METNETKDLNNEEKEIIEIVDGDEDDNAFMKSLEEYRDDSNQEKNEEEAQRLKNQNAEEARKRREAEAKAKLEQEAKAKEEQEAREKAEKEAKAKAELEAQKGEESSGSKEVVVDTRQEDVKAQVKELVTTHPNLDLRELDNDVDFQEYLKGKWEKGGPTITQIYNNYLNFRSRISKEEVAEIEKKYNKKSTPSLRSGGASGQAQTSDVYSVEEIAQLTSRLPYMNPKEYSAIEKKLSLSIKFHENNK